MFGWKKKPCDIKEEVEFRPYSFYKEIDKSGKDELKLLDGKTDRIDYRRPTK